MMPTDMGYLRCARCGCWRPAHLLVELSVLDATGARLLQHACADTGVCSRLAGVGDARLDKRLEGEERP